MLNHITRLTDGQTIKALLLWEKLLNTAEIAIILGTSEALVANTLAEIRDLEYWRKKHGGGS